MIAILISGYSISFVSQCFDWLQPRRSVGGIDAEEQSDADRNAEGQQHRGQRDHRRWKARARDRRDVWRLQRKRRANRDAKRATETAEHHRFDQELRENVAPPRPDRLANPDLSGALGD